MRYFGAINHVLSTRIHGKEMTRKKNHRKRDECIVIGKNKLAAFWLSAAQVGRKFKDKNKKKDLGFPGIIARVIEWAIADSTRAKQIDSSRKCMLLLSHHVAAAVYIYTSVSEMNEEAISGEERPTEINNTKRGKLLVISFPRFICDFLFLFLSSC